MPTVVVGTVSLGFFGLRVLGLSYGIFIDFLG
ncbi:MAG: photosystem II biosynthesis protein [cyanobacterium endosymbiont of Rhopalodia musculus]|nr:photosystem II biosynthesis protein [cyanobacterium endosymbiont of Epithemia clementina EcSB]WGT68496.1 photosystem II biosynthesis protein [cyanobacterium endosymbiont of Epithemia clementina EcSB]